MQAGCYTRSIHMNNERLYRKTEFYQNHFLIYTLRPDFTLHLVHGLAFVIPKFYIAPYDKTNNGFVNLSSNCNVKSDLRFHVELSSRISIRNTNFYIAPYHKINHGLVNRSSNCDVKGPISRRS